ncbi:MAG: acyl-CoA thioesterase II [Gammaproteobacteria bacterium]|nr:acyl-CoA thioesterase II [Gammaproteobacteria bacterium]
MDERLAALLQLLELERLEVNIFRGESRDIGSPQVYGGQVLGQALKAAYATVEPDRVAHSLHAYFLRRGDFNAPIVYFVDRARDGHSFTSRRVTAIQHGAQIFNLSASFQRPEPGIEHQAPMPQVPPPEALPEGELQAEMLARLPEPQRQFHLLGRPFASRPATPALPVTLATQCQWVRAVDCLPDDDALHRCLLAYASDFYLLPTATAPHALENAGRPLMLASIDHAMWFHRPVRVDEWLLCVTESPIATGARGFTRGSVYDRAGRLVASLAQEGLMRVVAGTGGSEPGGGAPGATARADTP